MNALEIRNKTGMKRRYKENEYGMSMISILVGVGILGMLATLLMQFSENSITAAKTIHFQGEVEDLRRTIRSRMSCKTTIAAINTNSNGNLRLLGRNGQPIANENSQFVYNIGKTITFKATSWNSTTGVLKIVVKSSSGDDFKDVFVRGGPIVCF
jgi:hypothetical protein